jgi:3-oxoacyl-[acyl-carrier-protein] synthase-3
MGWVGILSGIEETSGMRNFGASWPADRPQSVQALVEALLEARDSSAKPAESGAARAKAGSDTAVSVGGWGFVLGLLRIEAAAIESELGLSPGTLSERAGIHSVTRAGKTESETTLGLEAARRALEMADFAVEAVDAVIVTSATFLGFPSLAALLHTGLLLRESCAAIDVGGACLGLINALATAKGLLMSGQYRTALVIAAEVNSRVLSSRDVPGEFRGLFGDGACAFVLSRNNGNGVTRGFYVGDFIFGCSGAFASSLRLALRPSSALEVDFKGEQLASAAVSTLQQILNRLAGESGITISEVGCFALHEPNPRLVEILAQRAGISSDRIAHTAVTSGNLGSVTCGVNLCTALTRLAASPGDSRHRAIFVAAVGPGLLWGGTYLR